MSGKMDCFGLTDIGRKRLVNQDQFIVADLNKSMRVHQTSLGLDHQTRLFGNSQGKLLAVADGMGGHEAGERASQLVVDSVVTYVLNTLNWYFRLGADSDEDFRDDLKAGLQHCQEMLQRDVEAAPQRRGMGTTLTMAYVIWPRMYVVHVGDSRCYLLRDGKLIGRPPCCSPGVHHFVLGNAGRPPCNASNIGHLQLCILVWHAGCISSGMSFQLVGVKARHSSFQAAGSTPPSSQRKAFT